MGGKSSTKYNENPGPGSYNANSSVTKSQIKSYKIGTSRRLDITNSRS